MITSMRLKLQPTMQKKGHRKTTISTAAASVVRTRRSR